MKTKNKNFKLDSVSQILLSFIPPPSSLVPIYLPLSLTKSTTKVLPNSSHLASEKTNLNFAQ